MAVVCRLLVTKKNFFFSFSLFLSHDHIATQLLPLYAVRNYSDEKRKILLFDRLAPKPMISGAKAPSLFILPPSTPPPSLPSSPRSVALGVCSESSGNRAADQRSPLLYSASTKTLKNQFLSRLDHLEESIFAPGVSRPLVILKIFFFYFLTFFIHFPVIF